MNTKDVLENSHTHFLTELSGNNAISCLLNCYIREYASAREEVFVDTNVADCPLALRQSVSSGSQLVCIDFPESSARILIVADIVSALQRCRFISRPYLKISGKPWLPVQAETLCRFLLKHLSLTLTDNFNEEFLLQVRNSIEVTQEFLAKKVETPCEDDSFIRSEQSLLWGHAMHPTPKSREGVSIASLLNCSPETAARFQLYWFEVDASLIKVLGNSEFDGGIVPAGANGDNPSQNSTRLYPCHPWEVETILENPLIQEAVERGLIKPRGYQGQFWAPTSSVRTLYHPQSPVQMKLSIHVRLTNCVRKNAWYELESAVVLTDLIQKAGKSINTDLPEFRVMLEPMATTIDLSALAGDSKQNHEEQCRESFGILYRKNIAPKDRERYQPVLAASLFSWNLEGQSVIAESLKATCHKMRTPYHKLATNWFDNYVRVLVPGVLRYFFELGIVFEPHLQNTVIGLKDGVPSCVWIRDLEGTKLLPEFWPEQRLGTLSERARSSVYYSRQKGWQRIAYCLLINNLSEAIFYLSVGEPGLEQQLWQKLQQALNNWQVRFGKQLELQGVLQGEAIPCKNNMITRLLKQADRLSSYTPLSNPMQWEPA
ncbi:IucA/IucC family protein [Microbulbifer epialgicus]|uniref:IucA/IucC family siderophore biosynthesis protein n=1 Tax=Microbulbifer epialgicus TaxID=393907 RepID=A0ABV4P351_9GAMM